MIFDTYACDLNEVKISPTEKSYEVPGFDGARASKLVPPGKLLCYRYPDAKTYIEMLERGCKLSDNGPCVRWRSSATEYSCLSYEEFMSGAKHFGSGLLKLGIQLGQENFICIYAQNSVEWLMAQTACFYYSAPIAPLHDVIGPHSRTFMINKIQTQVVICDTEDKVKALLDESLKTPSLKHIIHVKEVTKDLKELGKNKGICLHLFKEIEELGKKFLSPTKCSRPDDVAIICFTSGTTGDPKGAMITHKNLFVNISGITEVSEPLLPDKNDVSISYLPLAHIFEQLVSIYLFIHGGSVGFISGGISQLADDMKVLKPTIFPAVPRVLNKTYDKAILLQQKLKRNGMIDGDASAKNGNSENCEPVWNDKKICKLVADSLGGKVRLIISGSAPISNNVLDFCRKGLQSEVIEVYGQTECSGACAARIVDDKAVANVGAPTPSCIIKLVDVPELNYFKKDQAGEVCVKSPILCRGYFKDPVKTAEVFDEDGWLHTGDIGFWLPDGTLAIVDRKKDIFKLSQGEYIIPERIENIYLESIFVSQIFVHGESEQSYIVAVVVPDENALSAWCEENNIKGTWAEICGNEAVKQHILEDFQHIAKNSLYSFQQVKKIHLHPQMLTIEEGHLTPTQKMRRNVIRKMFKDKINEMYKQNS